MMNCPRCETAELLERERDGVIVDICPSCRGVWLDKGELDKMIARATAELNEFSGSRPSSGHPSQPGLPYPRPPSSRQDYVPDSDRHPHYDSRHKRKQSWLASLGDLFD
jgi:uncharacterized protein